MKITERFARESGKDYAVRMISENIINMKLEPGASISANELAAELGVSRGPVREALNELSKIGIVEIFPQSGCKISLIDYNMINQARFLRNTLECAVVMEVIQLCTPEDLLRMKENNKLLRFYQENKMADRLFETDNDFHRMLFEICNKVDVFELMKNFNIHSDRLRALTVNYINNATVVEDHGRIIDAIEAKNTGEAVRLMNMHLTRYTDEKEIIKNAKESYFKM